MYAIIDADGFQHKVAPGDTIRVQKMSGGEGSAVTFDKVLLLAKDDGVIVGSPYVAKASVTAEILSAEMGRKVVIFKKKPRKGHKKTQGHRQSYSVVSIKDIVVGG